MREGSRFFCSHFSCNLHRKSIADRVVSESRNLVNTQFFFVFTTNNYRLFVELFI